MLLSPAIGYLFGGFPSYSFHTFFCNSFFLTGLSTKLIFPLGTQFLAGEVVITTLVSDELWCQNCAF